MCVSLPRVLISVKWESKRSFRSLKTLEVPPVINAARSARRRAYESRTNSIWSGVAQAIGPRSSTLILLDNGPHQRAGGFDLARNSGLHTLRRVPQRLPRVPANRWPRVRLHLRRADRGDSDAAVAVNGAFADTAICFVAVRSLLRSVPGQNRYSRNSDSSAEQAGGEWRRAHR